MIVVIKNLRFWVKLYIIRQVVSMKIISNEYVQSISENNTRSDFGSTKNEMLQLLIKNTLLRPDTNFNDIENMIVTCNGSLF